MPAGRPSKYSPELVARISALLRKGMPRTRAARRAGIAVSTFMDWMNEKAEFSEAVHDAEDAWVEKAMGKVTDLVDSEDEKVALQAAKFGLSTRFREDFARREERTGPDGAPIGVSVSGTVNASVSVPWERLGEMSSEQLEALGRGLSGRAEIVSADGSPPPGSGPSLAGVDGTDEERDRREAERRRG